MLILKPFIGINNFTFNHNEEEISRLNGEPFKIEINNIMKQTKEFRKGTELIFINSILQDIYIKKTEPFFYQNINIFNDSDVVEQLSNFSRVVKGKRGTYFLFEDIGLCLGGFSKKKIPEGKLAIAFSKERTSFYKKFIDV
jgi:hypothetical protein